MLGGLAELTRARATPACDDFLEIAGFWGGPGRLAITNQELVFLTSQVC